MSKSVILVVAVIALLANTGCSIRRFAINKIGDAIASGGTTYQSDDDLELVGDALPFGLKLMESLLAETPRHKGLLKAACEGFTCYSYLYAHQQADRMANEDLASANWPLMRTISEASGGFYAAVSNDDDIIGQILLAKGKIAYESLHDATLRISGVKTLDSTKESLGKVYRGQQLVIFGRYEQGGEAQVTLKARLSGEDKVYSTKFQFPDIETTNPEMERLYALARIEELEVMKDVGTLHPSEAETAIRDLGLNYQLVTDYTSMIVLSDESFTERGIGRRNQARVARELQARTARAQQPVRDWRVDRSPPAFSSPSPSVGGGAVDPLTAGIALGLAGMTLAGLTRRRERRKS